MKIVIKTIKVSDRIRKDFGDIDELAASLARIGQIQPIVLDSDNNLLAGGRRIAAAIHNGWTEIDAVRLEELDSVGKKEVELEENLRRKDLNWVEEVQAVKSLYDLKVSKYGAVEDKVFRNEEAYTIRDASSDMDKSIGMVSMDLNLAKALIEFPIIAEEKSKASAWKRFRREKETKIRTEQARRTRSVPETTPDDSLDPNDAPSREELSAYLKALEDKPQGIKKISWQGKGILYLANCIDVLKISPDKSVDCIVTDPPFGLGMFKSGDATGGSRLAESAGHMYDDDPATIMDMLDQVFMHCARVLKNDGHAYVFFHHTKYEPVFLILRKHFGTCEETPIIWIKNTPGIGDPNTTWVYAYEPCFWVNKGRHLVKPQAFNYLKCDTVSPNKKIHPTQKPDALLRHIISASCLPGEIVLDPFAGSGSTLVAASQLGCRFIGIEKEEKFHRAAVDRISEEIAAADETEP